MVEFLQLVRCLKNLLMICWWLWWNDNSSSNKNTKTSTTTTIIKHYSSQAEETAEFWKSDNSNRTSTNRNSDCHDCVCVHACVRVCVWLLIPWKKCTFNQPPLFPQLCISCRVWVTEKRSSIVCWPKQWPYMPNSAAVRLCSPTRSCIRYYRQVFHRFISMPFEQ